MRARDILRHTLLPLTLCLAMALAVVPAAHAAGEEFTERAKETEDALDTVRDQLESARSEEQSLAKEKEALDEEAKALSDRLIALAASIQSREGAITTAERRLDGLDAESKALRSKLADRHYALAELLAGLQRLERNPPPALAVKPDDALAALRGAMLLGTVVPELEEEANALSRDLARLRSLREQMIREGETVTANLARLRSERAEIETLLERKSKLAEAAGQELATSRERADELSRKAESLKQLLSSLEEQRRKAEEEAKRAEERRLAKAMEPQVPFTEIKGRLGFPVQGALVSHYGSNNGFGGKVRGDMIATRPNAQVTAPADGHIEFAGTFRSYGQLLILNVGEGYHILLAGLNEISVGTGQFVRAGEPVGTMGDGPARATLIGDRLGDPRPVLYIEFRRDGETIDPAPWWVGTDKEARG
ncbi:peptidoglycan DD-metalloendopeptidase family protein [Kaustia mangrovi]|uniref:Peptidoglycan DD-metalloendopeptidase family protein n=1 Tax=Kaustia mangrovi TaxID=2593653 RepID=A0A7S8C587_9HYPH|nr:peptidoglycan DD-metalloendopeptidase family protein [Kaustia mangrovi]QPC43645.1 peptidoglycan DD-metalloendopeptidase family protein [Kaustia mangrovi]